MIDTSKIYKSNNYGCFKVVEYINRKNVLVKFVDTGFEAMVDVIRIKRGTIKDKTKPVVFGVGFIGSGPYKSRANGKPTKSYQAWTGMLERCYYEKYQELYPAYKGCSVCSEWLDFQVFAKWFDRNYIKDYHLDKDIKIKGNKVYSDKTCLFVTNTQNTIHASAKSYEFIDPEGNNHRIYNLRAFCRDKDLQQSDMCKVHSGKNGHHKGWIKA